MSIKQKVKDYLKETGNKVFVSVLTAIVLALLALMYGNRNEYIRFVIPFVFNYWVYIVIFICLIFLAIFYFRLRNNFLKSKPNMLEKQILDTKSHLESQIKINQDSVLKQIKNVETKLNSRLLDIEQTIVDFEIENHKNKNQVGAMSGLVKKLKMDRERGWGSEDTLFEIKEYIKDRGMPSYYLADLTQELGHHSNDLSILKNEILKLAQEKLYKVN